jgi:hypothetical protein
LLKNEKEIYVLSIPQNWKKEKEKEPWFSHEYRRLIIDSGIYRKIWLNPTRDDRHFFLHLLKVPMADRNLGHIRKFL